MTAVVDSGHVRHTSDELRAARVCAAWAAADLVQDYVVYERHGRWVFAGGAAVTIVLRPGFITTSGADGVRERPWSGTPAHAVAAELAALDLPEWRVYGWLGFDFCAHTLRATEHVASDSILAHLVVPEFEAWQDESGVHLTGGNEALRERLSDIAHSSGGDGGGRARPLDVNTDRTGYKHSVTAAVAEIAAGRYDKVILSRTIEVPFDVDIAATYAHGRASNNPARSFLLRLGDLEAAGFSPELVGSVDAHRTVVTEPLAGTRAFGRSVELDRTAREELESDAKEIVEHAVSVRTSFAEVDAVSVPGSTAVTQFMQVRERGSVQHLASTVRGTLAPHAGPWDAIDAIFPAVTASGVPKAASVDAIYRLEGNDRGLYSGAVVTATSLGEIEATLVLRTVFRQNGIAWIRAGAGIVAQSEPDREFEETCEKLASVAPYLIERIPSSRELPQ